MVVEVQNPRGKFQVLGTPLDTGTSHSVVFSKFVTLNELVDTGKGVTTWMTIAGSFTTRKVAMLHFQMPELSTSKEVERPCQVEEHTDRESKRYRRLATAVRNEPRIYSINDEIEPFKKKKTWNLEASWPLPMERRHVHPTDFGQT